MNLRVIDVVAEHLHDGPIVRRKRVTGNLWPINDTSFSNHLAQAVAQALDKADESTRRDYYRAIQSTKPDNRYREVLLACAMAEKNELGQFSASAVCAPYSMIRGAEMGVGHFARHLDAFCDPDRGPVLVKSGKRKGFMYRFFNPLLEPLVIMIGSRAA